MKRQTHLDRAQGLSDSMARLEATDMELAVEAAMLAGTHYLNAVLKRTDAGWPDVVHAEFMDAAQVACLDEDGLAAWQALTVIEGLRAWHVRGNRPVTESAWHRLQGCLDDLRQLALRCSP